MNEDKNKKGEELFVECQELKAKFLFQDALACLKEASELGFAQAQLELGIHHVRGTLCLDHNDAQSLVYLKKAAEQGNLRACYEYGLSLMENIDPNYKEWMEKGVKANDPYILGRLNYHGYLGRAIDNKKALDYFEKSAAMGDTDGQRIFGVCNFHGTGCIRDLKKALSIFKESAAKGDAISLHCIGKIFRMENGEVVRNLTAAWEFFRKAASQGYRPSIKILETDDVFEKFEQHVFCREAAYCLIAMRKFRKDADNLLNLLPLDVVVLIAKALWETRNDKEWTEKKLE